MNNLLYLIKATSTTLALAIAATSLGLIMAILFSFWESSRIKVVRWPSILFMSLVRGLPEILVVLLIYFGSSQLLLLLSNGYTISLGLWKLPIQLNIDRPTASPFLCGTIALALLYASYASQTLRGAMKSVSQGQWESGQALGISKITVFFRLILPQMWTHALPGLGNHWLVLLKDTALVSLISINDLMSYTKNLVARTHEPFSAYMTAAAIYLLITLISKYVIKRIRLRPTRFEGVAP